MFIYFLTCFLQPIILPVPEPVTIMAGSATFGPSAGAFIGFLGTILGITTMFFLSRLASEKLIVRFINEKKIAKFNKYIEKNEVIMLLGLFILPILPDEVICIGAGLARINKTKFILVAIFSKLVTSISLAYSISFFKISINDILSVFIIVAILSLIVKSIYKTLKNNVNVKKTRKRVYSLR